MTRNKLIAWVWLTCVIGCCLQLAMRGGVILGPPPPFGTDGLSVLIVEESQERTELPYEQQMIITGTSEDSVSSWMNKNCAKSQKGLPHWRILDKDQSVDMDEPWVKEAMSVKREGVPWMIVANKRTGFSSPLAKDTKEMLARLSPLGEK